MRDMRRLGSLIIAFKEAGMEEDKQLNSEDLLDRCNIDYLERAVDQLSHGRGNDEDALKAGTKLGLGYVVKQAAEVMKVKYLIANEDEKAKSVDNFMTVFKLKWAYVFGEAEVAVVDRRQERLRQPAQLPVEEEVAKLRNYTVTTISQMVEKEFEFWTSQEFSPLRDLVVSRLTLFNARRGGEPSRLLLKEWEAADKDVWLPQQTIEQIDDPAERLLAGSLKIAYQSGKGSQHLVSLLIPTDCVKAMTILVDSEVRRNAGVNVENPFVFPYTQSSIDHVSGWHATRAVCTAAGVKPITATDMRHRVSTYYASLEVPEADRRYFYTHMGHSERINMNIYQCPMAVAAVTKVGRHLSRLDTCGKCMCVLNILRNYASK